MRRVGGDATDPQICLVPDFERSCRAHLGEMLHFAFLLLVTSVSSCVRTTPSQAVTLSRARQLGSRIEQQPLTKRSDAHKDENTSTERVDKVPDLRKDEDLTTTRATKNELQIREHLQLYRNAAMPRKAQEFDEFEQTQASNEGRTRAFISEIQTTEDGSGEAVTTKVPIIHVSVTSQEDTTVAPQEQCPCPPLFMDHNLEPEVLCSNWKHVRNGFALKIAPRHRTQDVLYGSTKCSRTVTCDEPYMLVRWQNSKMCDVHAPEETKTDAPMFFYECNGTSWTMQNYPIDSIICAAKE